ncbi:MAG TPA: cache domain-containing protein [Candidatus Binatia bacterium]|nr:cache domain-containing protein [Candidatus Binatia bacterium]
MSAPQESIRSEGATNAPLVKRFSDSFAAYLLKVKNNRGVLAALSLTIVLPVVLIMIFSYDQAHRDLTEFTLSRRQSLAGLAAHALEQRLDRLTDLGVSLATRVRFRQLVAEGKWDEAIDILKSVPKDFPFIDRLFLADRAGVLMADTPALPGVRGQNFSSRDWYRGVSEKWTPYVSNVYQRAAQPRYNVIAAAIPIQAENERAVGILVLQVRLDALVGWSNSLDIGPSGFVYVVDRRGQLATHPGLPSESPIIDFARVPAVQRALSGQSGVEIMLNPIDAQELVAAYAPVQGVGWGVLATESAFTAFARRDENLRQLLTRYGLLLLISCGLAYLMLRIVIGLKEAERKIQVLNDELRRRALALELTNKELESFSYSVSHDLRAPLRSIDGFSQALVEDYANQLDGEAKNYLDRICVATRRMAQLIDDLLNLSRVTRSPLKVEPVDLSALVRAIAAELQAREPARRVEMAIGDGIAATGDRRLLRVALENLVGNAWKFTAKRDGAKIEFGIADNGTSRAYFVRDNGAGFDMAYSNKLFGAFQRLHSAAEFDGTGIGLATVQRIIHRHNGQVWAEGKVDQGATFYFTLGL